MELRHKKIPLEFLRRLPDGIKIVKRHGREFMVVEEILGPGGESLMSESVHIHGEPSIRLGVRIGEQQGLIFVDAFWGGHAKLYSFLPRTVADDAEVDAFVPETGSSLMVDRRCDEKGCSCARAIMLTLPDRKSRVYVCGRLGCPGHAIDIADMPADVSRTISSINFFGAGNRDEDWFEVF
ncbi:MAG: hypothetical protein EA384_11830 [Spirochaetaceae bacterium]|nr:MAG: hypothetical protein EA384_11830 [Spirochaetaceae bacterium]